MHETFRAVVASLCAAVAVTAGAASVYEYALASARHNELQRQLQAAVRSGDTETMERVCRYGVGLLPEDPLWHYNLACALAYRADGSEALDELARAVELGMRDVDAISADVDLKRVAADPRFGKIVARARELGDSPAPGREPRAPAKAAMGDTLTLVERNLTWDFDRSMFCALIDLVPPGGGAASLASRYCGPAAGKISAWMSAGAAAGNLGDLYVNRDSGHSTIVCTNFPGLTCVKYDAVAKGHGFDRMTPNTLFTMPVFGNASLGYTKGAYWRSAVRHNLTDDVSAQMLANAYANNQFWVFPALRDYAVSATGRVDYLMAASPCQLASVGASFTDRRFVNAALAASAAMRPDTKRSVLARHLMGPTIQWLLRRSVPGVDGAADYLSSKAHPSAFAPADLQVDRIVERAHALLPENVPPAATVALVNSREHPVVFPRPLVDYPDPHPELSVMTPFSVAFALRAPAAERRFMFQARVYPAETVGASFAWSVVHGPADAVRIAPPPGDSPAVLASGVAEITVDLRRLPPGERVDVACFAKTATTEWGAPSFMSFAAVPLEKREWREDGKVASIDYSNPDGLYCDPALALPRNWKDVYEYRDGKCVGFVRYENGAKSADFTADGRRVVERAADGAPARTVGVRYIPRSTGAEGMPPELIWVDAE